MKTFLSTLALATAINAVKLSAVTELETDAARRGDIDNTAEELSPTEPTELAQFSYLTFQRAAGITSNPNYRYDYQLGYYRPYFYSPYSGYNWY